MKQDKENYQKIKRYWRLLFKPRLELNCSYWKKYICFKHLMTEVDVVDYIISKNIELKNTYELYQSVLYSLQRKDYELFETIIEKKYIEISEYMQTSINTLEQAYSNGVMEKNNNTCKLIKRIAFGFRNFKNFKARILLITNIFRNTKRSMNFYSSLLNV